jgi:hypothetical protein
MAALPLSRLVPVHLTIRRPGEDFQVDFPYDPAVDSVDKVARELGEQVSLTEADLEDIKKAIYDQITKHPSAPVLDPTSDDESDGPLDDQGYRELCERQAKELEELEARHQAEQRELLAPAKNRSDDLLVFE